MCSDEGSIPGAYSPGVQLRTHKVQPVAVPESTDLRPAQQSALKLKLQEIITAIKPERENQYALAFLLLIFVISVSIAGLLHYYMGR